MHECEWKKDALNGLALVSHSCGNSGEASLLTSDLSPVSTASRVVARSSYMDNRCGSTDHIIRNVGLTICERDRSANLPNS